MKPPLSVIIGFVPDLRSIASRQNPLVKELRRAFQQAEPTPDNFIAIEGIQLIEEAIRSGLRLRTVFVSQSAQPRAERLLPQLSRHVEAVLLPDAAFSSAVATESPQGVAALVALPQHSLDAALAVANPLAIVAAGLQDPGNLGTIIRSAEAFGATGLVAIEGTVNPFNPKVIRGSAGSVFRLPLSKSSSASALQAMRDKGLRILATSSHKSIPLSEADLTGPLAILIGNEGAGVPRELLSQATQNVVIPHSQKVESLNAGIAASVVLYECARQRH